MVVLLLFLSKPLRAYRASRKDEPAMCIRDLLAFAYRLHYFSLGLGWAHDWYAELKRLDLFAKRLKGTWYASPKPVNPKKKCRWDIGVRVLWLSSKLFGWVLSTREKETCLLFFQTWLLASQLGSMCMWVCNPPLLKALAQAATRAA